MTYALSLDNGVPQYAGITDASQVNLNITQDITIEVEAIIDTVSGDQTFVSKYRYSDNNRSYWFRYDAGAGQLKFVVSNNGTATDTMAKTIDLNAGVKYFLAVKWDASASTATFYVNGRSLGTATGSATSIYDSAAPFYIGTDDGTNSLGGTIRRVRIFDDLRSDDEIASDAHEQGSVSDANLQGEWLLDNDYLDTSGNGNDLTATGSPTFVGYAPGLITTRNTVESGNSATNTFSITVPSLYKGAMVVNWLDKGNDASGVVTWNGTDVPLIETRTSVTGAQPPRQSILLNPEAGTYNLVFESASNIAFEVIFYEGVDQVYGGVDNLGESHSNGSVTGDTSPYDTSTIQTVSDDSWIVGNLSPNGALDGGTDTIERGSFAISFDSGVGRIHGANSLQVTWASSTRNIAWCISALKPYIHPADNEVLFDAITKISESTATTHTIPHTCSGSDRILFVSFFKGGGSGNPVTGVTYNGVAMTQSFNVTTPLGGGRVYGYYLEDPASGENDIVISGSPGFGVSGYAASYSNVSGTPINDTDSDGSSGSSDQTVQLDFTTTEDDCLLIGFAWENLGGQFYSPGDGSAFRGLSSSFGFLDSVLPVGASGSHSLSASLSAGEDQMTMIGWAIEPKSGIAYSESFTETVVVVDNAVDVVLSKSLIETIVVSDAITQSIGRMIAETVVVADTLMKETGRLLNENVIVSGTVNTVRTAFSTLTETIIVSDSVSKMLGKMFTETVSILDAFANSVSRAMGYLSGRKGDSKLNRGVKNDTNTLIGRKL